MDIWDTAASSIEQRRANARAADQERARTQELEQQKRQDAYLQKMSEREAVCARVIPLLTTFINERGMSARRLIQARDPKHVVFIAGGKGGGGFWSVVFSVNGLEYVVGYGGGYGEPTITERRALSPEEAARKAIVELGCAKPDQLVEQLIDGINNLM